MCVICILCLYNEEQTSAVNHMDLFEVIGSYGPWQKRVVLFFFCNNIVGMWQTLSVTFLAPNVEFWCVEPAPAMFAKNATLANRCEVLVSNSTSVPCTKWEYDTSDLPRTMVSEWDLVCDRQWLVSLSKSVYMLGFLVSVFIFGQMSDWVGRLPAAVLSYAVGTASVFLSLLSTSYCMFVVLRFFQAFGRGGLTIVSTVLVMELVGPKHRIEAGAILQPGWALGFMVLAGVAWLVRPWFWLQLIIACSLLPFAVVFRFIPESPRWLLMKGKKERLERLLAEAMTVNRKKSRVSVDELELLKTHAKDIDSKNTKTFFHLLKMPKMRNRALVMFFLWMVNAFIYYGLSFNTNDVAGDPYLNCFISGALELPSYALIYWGIEKAGRRPIFASFMFGIAVSCAAMLAVPHGYQWLLTSLSMLGKFFVAGSFGLLYLYTSELFPTVVRNVSLGSCSLCARIGSILAPFVRELGLSTHPSVPNVLYGVLAVTTGLLALLLPETKGRNMPDTMEEGETFGQLSCPENPMQEKHHQKHSMHPLLLIKSTEINELTSNDSHQLTNNV